MHKVIVRGGEDFVAFAQRQALIEKCQAGGRVLRQRDVLRVATDVIGNGAADLKRNTTADWFEDRAVDGKQRVGVNLCPVSLDCLAHSSRVRREKKESQMNVI